jgi:hypothetical protein
MRASETNGHDDSFLMFALIMILNIRKSTVYFRPPVGRPGFIRFAKVNKNEKDDNGKNRAALLPIDIIRTKSNPFPAFRLTTDGRNLPYLNRGIVSSISVASVQDWDD